VVEPGASTKQGAREENTVANILSELNGSRDEYNIVVTARSRGTIPTALWNSSYFVFIGQGS